MTRRMSKKDDLDFTVRHLERLTVVHKLSDDTIIPSVQILCNRYNLTIEEVIEEYQRRHPETKK